MHIILTHEQADFDALASLLGAYLRDDAAIPVLPRRMNRNVQSFITLYGVDLPFVDPRDLSGGAIHQVTLVDTQSLISVKGMSSETRVQVIDHHPRRDELPEDWVVTTEKTGATATLFVEALTERDGRLSTVQATLLLLGIYEDTGSLTYTRTTPRDLQAAAYLLENGARLEIANDFLNHPLSGQQQALYDRLRAEAETVPVHGHNIVIACGDAQDVDEELSTVAHKMRDLLDPDALFLVVTVRGGVQLIARSTSDNIDVSLITEHFGGGGHQRAAASLIKDRQREAICQELKDLLPKFVRPSITVAQIMSHDPQLLRPDTTVEEAARRMQRYGYEGYPVVRDGEVIGLLTRRAVDRAISHKLNLEAERLMDAGGHTVEPGDSIEELQRVMTDTGWGQIPVVQPESQQVIGIVTRTDLLKTLTQEPKIPGRQNLAEKLATALPASRLALLKEAARLADEKNSALYIVGGFVRDLILERPSLDLDLVVEGDAIELAHALAEEYGGRVTHHARFGTAKWHIDEIRSRLVEKLAQPGRSGETGWDPGTLEAEDLPDSLDLITARTEFYAHPTALPTVERGSIKLDLHRRDFTINTLALRLDGRHYGDLHDYWGGMTDLNNGLVRVLHSLSFVDDPTRMLRAVRFEQRFDFRIEQRTMQLLLDARPLLDRISGDRIRHELNYILEEPRLCRMMERLQSLDLLKTIHKDLRWRDWLCEKTEMASQSEPEQAWGILGEGAKGLSLATRLVYAIWLIDLSPSGARGAISRLRIPRSLADEVLAAQHLLREEEALKSSPASVTVKRLDQVPPLSIYATYLISDDEEFKRILHRYAFHWKNIQPTIDGHDLRALEIPPGPVYRIILGELRDAWIDERITTPVEERALIEDLLHEHARKNQDD